MVTVIGILTFGAAAPGLNRQLLNALTAALSKTELPMLCAMVASVTLPLATSTDTTQTPLPMSRRARASYGYAGFGAYTATAFALEIDIVPAWPTVGALIGAIFACLGTRGGGVVSSRNSGTFCGSGGGVGATISSGGGVGCCSGSNDASTVAIGISVRSIGGCSRFWAIATAVMSMANAIPRHAQTFHRGGGT